MTHETTIAMLLLHGTTEQEPLKPEQWKRVAARVAWVKETMAKWRDAQERCDAAWDRLIAPYAHLDDEALEALDLPEPPEEAEVNAIYAQLRAVIDRDEWPRDLYFGGI